jgi:hypothetical protein
MGIASYLDMCVCVPVHSEILKFGFSDILIQSVKVKKLRISSYPLKAKHKDQI